MELLIKQLEQRISLNSEQARSAIDHLVSGAVDVETKARFLSALAQKGETVEEIATFAIELRKRAIRPLLDDPNNGEIILDVCGTGGDRLNTFNISTTVALVASSAGILVAKHGNRAVTSASGSADVLEALGVPIDLEPKKAAQSLKEHRFVFLFAPRYHPAFAHIGPARKICAQRGQRTIFNFLGPLLNPVQPTAQLVGVSDPALCEPLAYVLQSLGVRRGMVVSGNVPHSVDQGEDKAPMETGEIPSTMYLDELSTLGASVIAEFYQDRGFSRSELKLESFPLQQVSLGDLAGGDRKANASTIERLLRGEERGPKRDAVLLNSGAALFVGGKATSITEGWMVAQDLIDSGRAWKKLQDLRTS